MSEKRLVFKPITREGNFYFNRVTAIFLNEKEPTEVYLDFDGNESDIFEEKLGAEYELEQSINPSDIDFFRVKSTGRIYALKYLDYDTKMVVTSHNIFFKMSDTEIVITWAK